MTNEIKTQEDSEFTRDDLDTLEYEMRYLKHGSPYEKLLYHKIKSKLDNYCEHKDEEGNRDGA